MLKIEKDYNEGGFENMELLYNALLDLSKSDEELKTNLDKPNKNLTDLYKYLEQEARKKLKDNARFIGVSSVDLIKWSRKYYEDDSIDFAIKEKVKTKIDEVELPQEELDDFDL